MIITPEQVAALKANATPGPFEEKDGQIWATWPDMDDGWRFRHCIAELRTDSGWPKFARFEGCDGNGKLFAAAPDMADLIARQDEALKAAEQLYRATEFLADNDPDEVVCDGGGTAILVGLSGIRKALAAYLAAREKLK